MNLELMERLKIVAIYWTVPSFERDEALDKVLEAKGYITLGRHGATITDAGRRKVFGSKVKEAN